eukprot:Lithocolla_globosa_v1_NODE_969_length_3008_cov_31.801219.p3 type:complete len:132 gc:universal NODE_969_length_3008_cov_31.801219:2461-2066(-)
MNALYSIALLSGLQYFFALWRMPIDFDALLLTELICFPQSSVSVSVTPSSFKEDISLSLFPKNVKGGCNKSSARKGGCHSDGGKLITSFLRDIVITSVLVALYVTSHFFAHVSILFRSDCNEAATCTRSVV